MVEYRKLYDTAVKKFLIALGLAIPLGVGAFLLLAQRGDITITGYSGDSVCAGTELDPCYAYLNFTANTDIFLYLNDTTWSALETDTQLKSLTIQRSWGKGWRTIDLQEGCTGTWCGLSNADDKRVFSYAFREGRNYSIRFIAMKNDPFDDVKWGFGYEGTEESYVDPTWLGVGEYKLMDDWYYGRKYTPNELVNFHMVLNVTLDKRKSFNSDKLTWYIGESMGEFNIHESGVDMLQDFTYNKEIWERNENCTDFREYGNDTWNEYTTCNPYMEFKGLQLTTEKQWLPLPSGKITLDAGTSYYFDLWFVKPASLEPFAIDIVPMFDDLAMPDAAWFSGDWTYRRAITNSTPNYRSRFTALDIDLGTLIEAGKVQKDFSDIRIVSENGTTEYDRKVYYVEQMINSTIWFNYTTTDGVYYIYYGNNTAVTPPYNYNLTHWTWYGIDDMDWDDNMLTGPQNNLWDQTKFDADWRVGGGKFGSDGTSNTSNNRSWTIEKGYSTYYYITPNGSDIDRGKQYALFYNTLVADGWLTMDIINSENTDGFPIAWGTTWCTADHWCYEHPSLGLTDIGVINSPGAYMWREIAWSSALMNMTLWNTTNIQLGNVITAKGGTGFNRIKWMGGYSGNFSVDNIIVISLQGDEPTDDPIFLLGAEEEDVPSGAPLDPIVSVSNVTEPTDSPTYEYLKDYVFGATICNGDRLLSGIDSVWYSWNGVNNTDNIINTSAINSSCAVFYKTLDLPAASSIPYVFYANNTSTSPKMENSSTAVFGVTDFTILQAKGNISVEIDKNVSIFESSFSAQKNVRTTAMPAANYLAQNFRLDTNNEVAYMAGGLVAGVNYDKILSYVLANETWAVRATLLGPGMRESCTGITEDADGMQLWIIAGKNDTADSNTIYVWSEINNSVSLRSTTSGMALPVVGYSAMTNGCVDDNRYLFCFGGYDAGGATGVPTVWKYDTQQGVVSNPANLTYSVKDHVVSCFDDFAIIAGGYHHPAPLDMSHVTKFVFANYTETPMTNLSYTVREPQGAEIRGTDSVVFCGGYSSAATINTCGLFNVKGNAWDSITALTGVKRLSSGAGNETCVIMPGGWDGSPTDVTDVYCSNRTDITLDLITIYSYTEFNTTTFTNGTIPNLVHMTANFTGYSNSSSTNPYENLSTISSDTDVGAIINITGWWEGNENYTRDSNTQYAVFRAGSGGPAVVNLSIDWNRSSASAQLRTYPNVSWFNITEYISDDTGCSFDILIDDVSQSSADFTDQLSAGTYNVTGVIEDCDNYANNQSEITLTVGQGSPTMDMWINGTKNTHVTQTYPADTNITCNLSITQGGPTTQFSYIMYLNSTSAGTQVGTDSTRSDDLWAVSHNFTCDYLTNENYTNATRQQELVLNKATPNVHLYADGQNSTLTKAYTTGATNITGEIVQCDDCYFKLLRNGTNIVSVDLRIPNPDFDNDINNWQTQLGTPTVDNTQAEYNYSLFLDVAGGEGVIMNINDSFIITPSGRDYYLHFWHYHNSDSTNSRTRVYFSNETHTDFASVHWYRTPPDANTSTVCEFSTPVQVGTHQYISLKRLLTGQVCPLMNFTGAQVTKIRISPYTNGDDYWIDNFFFMGSESNDTLGFGQWNFTFLTYHNANYTNSSIERIVNITQATSICPIYINGSSNRSVELWEPINITTYTNANTTMYVWSNIYSFGNRSGTGSVSYNNYLHNFTQTNFSNGDVNQTLYYSPWESGWSTRWITWANFKNFEVNLKNFRNLTIARLNMTGHYANGTWPGNISITTASNMYGTPEIGSMSDVVLPGYLNGTTLTQNQFTNGLSFERIDFSTAGSVIRYLNYSLNNLSSVRPMNITIYIGGEIDNPNPIDVVDDFRNYTYLNLSMPRTSNVIIYDDFSSEVKPKRYTKYVPPENTWWNTYGWFNVTGGTLIHENQFNLNYGTEVGTSYIYLTGQNSGGLSTQLDIQDFQEWKVKVKNYIATTCVSYGGEVVVSGSGTSTFGIYDVTTGTDHHIIKAETTNCATKFGATQGTVDQDSSIWTINQSGGQFKWYDDDATLIGTLAIDTSHTYTFYWKSEVGYDATASGTVSVDGYNQVFNITASGLTGYQNSGMGVANGTMFSGQQFTNWDGNIKSVYIDADVGGNTLAADKVSKLATWEVSNDNMTTWEEATLGKTHVFSSTGRNLTYRVLFNTSKGGGSNESYLGQYMPYVRNINVIVSAGNVSNLSIDIGNDGVYEWNSLEEVNSSIQYVARLNNSAIIQYLSTKSGTTALLPIKFTAGDSGTINYSNMQAKTNVTYVDLNISKINDWINGYDWTDWNSTPTADVKAVSNWGLCWGGIPGCANTVTQSDYMNDSGIVTSPLSSFAYWYGSAAGPAEFWPNYTIPSNATRAKVYVYSRWTHNCKGNDWDSCWLTGKVWNYTADDWDTFLNISRTGNATNTDIIEFPNITDYRNESTLFLNFSAMGVSIPTETVGIAEVWTKFAGVQRGNNLTMFTVYSSNGTINITNLQFVYPDDTPYKIWASTVGNANFSSCSNATNLYGRYSAVTYNLPYSWTDTLLWYPSSYNSTQVSPWGQTPTVPIYNITWDNWERDANLGMKINESMSCANITVSNTTGYSSFNLTTSFQTIEYNVSKNTPNTTVWAYLDLTDCNSTSIRKIVRQAQLKACCDDCMRCW